MTNIYEDNFKLMDQLLGRELHNFASGEKTYIKLHAPGYMDLIVEFIGINTLSMTHYFSMNGDLVQDPEMVILVDLNLSMVEALSFQNMYVYQEVYENLERTLVYTQRKAAQNMFLTEWLKNLRDQGYFLSAPLEGRNLDC
ncbi:DUF1249 domain-containing protein [Paenibacillus agricola]|uniref:DUF1249 domain-containing protein n=1 Tax=Paenibacillus agricola TaxID=2716264 RepID=A0ABX0JIK0_9BACL|nr:DUF1249 domain-containing protein [Paenibacillus agricola]NHN34812.1 DUF1249 domain-containing protein [Paenibacillus agricola]